jgi:hypothetical protein
VRPLGASARPASVNPGKGPPHRDHSGGCP